MKLFLGAFLFATALPAATIPSMDSDRGRLLFQSQNCVRCHRMNGEGGRSAPDLGQITDRGFTPGTLAGTMWNHAPTMWSAFRDERIAQGILTNQNAADLFAAFYSARFFDMPSNAVRGKALFTSKACIQCHGADKAGSSAAKPAREWAGTLNAVSLVTAMSNHTATMRNELASRGISWPTLSGADLGNLLIYVRSLPGWKHGAMPVFRIAVNDEGALLFQSKGCISCHAAGSLHTAGMGLDEIAASLWNHAAKPGIKPVRFEASEMSALLGYIWAEPFFQNAGNAARGARVFGLRRCDVCHGVAGSGAPNLLQTSTPRNGITMVSSLWRHGPAMLGEMNRKQIPWPVFKAGEMSDLIAYLNSESGKH